MVTRIKAELTLEERGAFLEHRDSPIIRGFFEDAKQLVSKAGEDRIRERITARARHPTGKPGGHFAAGIITKDYAKGRTITAEYPQILRGPWLEGSSIRNTSTHFRGYRMFRLTRTWLRRNYMKLIQDLLTETVAKLNASGGGS